MLHKLSFFLNPQNSTYFKMLSFWFTKHSRCIEMVRQNLNVQLLDRRVTPATDEIYFTIFCVQCFQVNSAVYVHMAAQFLAIFTWWHVSPLCENNLISFTTNVISKLTHTTQNKYVMMLWLVYQLSVLSRFKNSSVAIVSGATTSVTWLKD
jgi:hypothetical protein